MMNKEKSERVEQLFDEYADELYAQDMAENPHIYDHMIENFMHRVEEKDIKPQKHWSFVKRFGVCAASIVLILAIAVVVVDIPAVRAFKSGVEESVASIFGVRDKEGQYESLEQLNEKRGINLPLLHYVPDGYAQVGEVTYSEFSGFLAINVAYESDDGYISVLIEGLPDAAASDFVKLDDYEYIEDENKIIALSQKPPYNAEVYMGMYKYSIDGSLSKEELLKVIENIY